MASILQDEAIGKLPVVELRSELNLYQLLNEAPC
jgi:hypothetical protein